MSFLAVHVKSLRKNAGLTQEQLGKRIGVGKTTINNIESGYVTAPSMQVVDALAAAFSTDSYSLLHKVSPDVGERAKMIHVVHSISSKKPFIEISKIVETMFLDRDMLRGYEYFAIKMPDNSMIDAHICPGANVVIRQDAKILKNGDKILAVYNDCDGVVRRYYSDGDTIILKAANDSGLYPDICLDAKKDRFVAIGKVIQWVNMEE